MVYHSHCLLHTALSCDRDDCENQAVSHDESNESGRFVILDPDEWGDGSVSRWNEGAILVCQNGWSMVCDRL
jgi:hypothetical protein